MSLPKSARVRDLIPARQRAPQYVADSELGPAMAALNDRQRAFVLTLIQTGCTRAEAARVAGYEGDSDTLKSAGYRLAHTPKVQAALQEEAVKLMRDHAPVMIEVLHSIAINPQADAKDRIRAAGELLSRSGLGTMSEHKITVEKTFDEKALIADIVRLAKSLDIDPDKLLGRGTPKLAGPVVDAEFAEVTPIPEDLKDIL